MLRKGTSGVYEARRETRVKTGMVLRAASFIYFLTLGSFANKTSFARSLLLAQPPY